MSALLTALGAAVAVAVELLEALAIVVAVGVSRGWSDAVAGALAGVAVCALAAAALIAGLIPSIPIASLRLWIGGLLLLFGLEWLRKATLRLAGRKARSSITGEYEQTRTELARVPFVGGGPDWAARIVAFKGVLLEGIEIVLIVTVLGAAPDALVPAVAGAAVAAFATVWAGFHLRSRIPRIPETELKWGVGVLLTTLGTFFAGEGLELEWPGGDVALLYVGLAVGAASLARVRALGPGSRTA